MHRQLGASRAVLVQPSPYGTDNSCLLSELRRRGDQARGVVVIDPAAGVPPRDWHALGVRGVRINLATVRCDDQDVARTMLSSAAAAVADLGWHLQLFVELAMVAALADDLAPLPVPVVLDHYGLAAARLGPLSQASPNCSTCCPPAGRTSSCLRRNGFRLPATPPTPSRSQPR